MINILQLDGNLYHIKIILSLFFYNNSVFIIAYIYIMFQSIFKSALHIKLFNTVWSNINILSGLTNIITENSQYEHEDHETT